MTPSALNNLPTEKGFHMVPCTLYKFARVDTLPILPELR